MAERDWKIEKFNVASAAGWSNINPSTCLFNKTSRPYFCQTIKSIKWLFVYLFIRIVKECRDSEEGKNNTCTVY